MLFTLTKFKMLFLGKIFGYKCIELPTNDILKNLGSTAARIQNRILSKKFSNFFVPDEP